MNNNWTWEDYATLRNCYPSMGADITTVIEGRSLVNIEARAEKLNTHIKKPFTDNEKHLAKYYKSTLGTALIFLLPDRSPSEIKELLECINH